MYLKILGACLVVLGCGGVGFGIANGCRQEEKALRQLLSSLDYMQCELQYRLTPLPELCRKVSAASEGLMRPVFLGLAVALEDRITPDVERCMDLALGQVCQMPKLAVQVLSQLGRSLGRFDLEGQLRGLEAAREEARGKLEALEKDRAVRMRTYQTLGLCAGAALAILLI